MEGGDIINSGSLICNNDNGRSVLSVTITSYSNILLVCLQYLFPSMASLYVHVMYTGREHVRDTDYNHD